MFESKPLFVSYDLISDCIDGTTILYTLVERLSNRNEYVKSLIPEFNFTRFDINRLNVDVNIVDGVELDIEAFKKWRNGEYDDAEFILEDGKYICGVETEKMSKSKYNTVNPDVLIPEMIKFRSIVPLVRNAFARPEAVGSPVP